MPTHARTRPSRKPCAASHAKPPASPNAKRAPWTRKPWPPSGGASTAAPIRTAAPPSPWPLCPCLSDGGLRISEAAALDWDDVATEGDGSGRITIRQSKTDAEGEGAVVAITARAMADLERVAFLRGNHVGKVFRLGPRQIARRLKRAAKEAGLGDGFSGHSGRVGCAVRMTRAGAPSAAVMRQGRWATPRMVARYTRNEDAAEALRYL